MLLNAIEYYSFVPFLVLVKETAHKQTTQSICKQEVNNNTVKNIVDISIFHQHSLIALKCSVAKLL